MTAATKGLLVRLEAEPGKEGKLADFLAGALELVEAELQTTAWFAVRLSESAFAIFDVFPDEAGRAAHLAGPVAAALGAHADELLAVPPAIEHADVLAAKVRR